MQGGGGLPRRNRKQEYDLEWLLAGYSREADYRRVVDFGFWAVNGSLCNCVLGEIIRAMIWLASGVGIGAR